MIMSFPDASVPCRAGSVQSRAVPCKKRAGQCRAMQEVCHAMSMKNLKRVEMLRDADIC